MRQKVGSIWVLATVLFFVGDAALARAARGGRFGANRGASVASDDAAAEIDAGFVVFKGRYLPPPYTVQRTDKGVCVNGLKVLTTGVARFRRGPFRPGSPGPGPRGREAATVERHLAEEGMVICTGVGDAEMVTPGRTITILETLLGEDPPESKVKALMAIGGVQVASGQWAVVVRNFAATPELLERVATLKQRYAELDAQCEPARGAPEMLFSGVTIAGFALAVWAFGTLLCCRPPIGHLRHSADFSGDSSSQVWRLVAVVVVLSLYDLVCTLLGRAAAGIWELNPVANSLMANFSHVVVFKLALTVGAAALFLIARRCRLAQVGSWWVGVVYTVLILRWTTCNSLLIA
ncbi:MAG: hypothetical protein JW741_20820 [Sedimentisphaerales bacterium]|nr:hypothetical protein [Sedimentisphaerales bacterium]